MKRRLQVFVSSTFDDLKNERQAAVGAILKLGHFPAGMELFTAGDKSQLEIIKKWIDESDVFMLILGGRYGSVEPDSGVSYTELEYNYALEIEKPLFAVVIKENSLEQKVRAEGTAVIERDRPAELKLFREKVLTNMSSFFEDTKDIKLAIMESLPEIASENELAGWISGNEIPDTKGLVDEIARLHKEINSLTKEKIDFERAAPNNDQVTSHQEFSDLAKVLESIEIAIPKSATGEAEDSKNTLYSIFINVQDDLVVGVTNQRSMPNRNRWIYFNVCPKLQIHGLVQNEKVEGVQYRRFAITDKGQCFLAHIAKRKVIKQAS